MQIPLVKRQINDKHNYKQKQIATSTIVFCIKKRVANDSESHL